MQDKIGTNVSQEEYTKSEVTKILHVSEATLRNWERYFDLKIERKKGNRVYTQNTLKHLQHIQEALEQYGTLEETKKYLSETGVSGYNKMMPFKPETIETGVSDHASQTRQRVEETKEDSYHITLLIKELTQIKNEALSYANQAIEYAQTAGQVKLLEDLTKSREHEYFKVKYENEQLKQQLEILKEALATVENQQNQKQSKWFHLWKK